MLMKIFYLTLLSVSISCSKEDGGDSSESGQEHSIEIELPFTLNKSNATISASSKYTGKVWIFNYESGTGVRYSPIVAYLNATDVTSATKLKASAETNAGNAQLDSSKKYIVFAEVNGVLHVFSM